MSTGWKYLVPKPGSVYRELFLRGTRIMARIVYGMYVREQDPLSPQEIANAFGVPIEAILEAIAHCESSPPEIREDWDREEAKIRSKPTRGAVSGAPTNPHVAAPEPLPHR